MNKLQVLVGGIVNHATTKSATFLMSRLEAGNCNSQQTINIFAR